MAFTLRSSAFVEDGEIPKRYTGDGEDLSPSLSWGALPHGVKELALICEDMDPRLPKPWIHWLLYKIPTSISSLDEGLAKTTILQIPAGLFQGVNSWGKIGYSGPLPPSEDGWHSYRFRLYALGTELSVKAGISKDELLEVMNGHIRMQVALVGRYQRMQERLEPAP